MKILDKLIKILSDERRQCDAAPEYLNCGKVKTADRKSNGKTPVVKDDEKPALFRALCNVRPPMPVSAEFLKLQDEYLTGLSKKRGTICADELRFSNGIALWQGDMTRLTADGIVNACNCYLLGCFQPLHGCIDNAIHSFAGVQVRLDCNEIMKGGIEKEGQVKVTKAYNLPSKFIFHTVGPQVNGKVTEENREKLEGCYISCIRKAQEMNLSTLAFCCISTGVYGYPKDEAAQLAVNTVKKYKGDLKIIFCVFDEENYNIYGNELGKSD